MARHAKEAVIARRRRIYSHAHYPPPLNSTEIIAQLKCATEILIMQLRICMHSRFPALVHTGTTLQNCTPRSHTTTHPPRESGTVVNSIVPGHLGLVLSRVDYFYMKEPELNKEATSPILILGSSPKLAQRSELATNTKIVFVVLAAACIGCRDVRGTSPRRFFLVPVAVFASIIKRNRETRMRAPLS